MLPLTIHQIPKYSQSIFGAKITRDLNAHDKTAPDVGALLVHPPSDRARQQTSIFTRFLDRFKEIF